MDAVWSEFQELGERSPLGIGIAGLREPFKARLVEFADRVVDETKKLVREMLRMDPREIDDHVFVTFEFPGHKHPKAGKGGTDENDVVVTARWPANAAPIIIPAAAISSSAWIVRTPKFLWRDSS